MKRRAAESPDQGSLFGLEWRPNGQTDPVAYAVDALLTPTPEGTFPIAEKVDRPALIGDAAVSMEAVRRVVATNHRRAAQRGRHSVWDHEPGLYRAEDVVPGKFVPESG
jgi:hypothetical protein